MEKLETLIQELYQETGLVKRIWRFFRIFVNWQKKKNNLLFLLAMQMVKRFIEDYSLDDGQDVFVAFTTQAQVDLGQATETLNQSVMDVLHMVHEYTRCKWSCIKSLGRFVFFTKSFN